MDPLHQRLRDELTHEVSPEVRGRHLAAASAARDLEPLAPASASGIRWLSGARRRVAVGAAAFGLIAVPAGAMAQDALPGDALYPVKLALEPVQALFDDDVVATHRADEVHELLDAGESPSESLERVLVRAEEALAESSASENARARVAEACERFEAKRAEQAERGERPDTPAGPPTDAPAGPPSDASSERGRSGDAPGQDARPTDPPSDAKPSDAPEGGAPDGVPPGDAPDDAPSDAERGRSDEAPGQEKRPGDSGGD